MTTTSSPTIFERERKIHTHTHIHGLHFFLFTSAKEKFALLFCCWKHFYFSVLFCFAFNLFLLMTVKGYVKSDINA